MVEITVVGGGLAGLYAAYGAASISKYANVKLIEKSKIGEKHNCGELFTNLYLSAPQECVIHEIDCFRVHLPDSCVYDIKFDPSPFVMTDKLKHEKIMKEKCESLGVEIRENEKYDLNPENRVDLSWMINASGASCYEKNKGVAVSYVVKREYWETEENTAHFYIRPDMMGYAWVFPKGDHINIGEGVCDLKTVIKFDKPEECVSRGSGVLPMPTMKDYYDNLNEIGFDLNDGILKVGNAFGLVNPCLGGGEHLAALSGFLAGQLVASGKPEKYAKALDDIVGDEMRFGISFYGYFRKNDMDTLKSFVKNFGFFDEKIVNKNTRKRMKKWLTVPKVSEDDVLKFVGE